jgi:hypothetical protein
VVCSGSLVAKAVECGLRCLMLERGWRFVGESIFVESTFAASEERTDLCALNVVWYFHPPSSRTTTLLHVGV